MACLVLVSSTVVPRPASAVTEGVVHFAGTNVLFACPGFGFPATPPIFLSPDNCGFTFVSNMLCNDNIGNVAKPPKPPGVVGLACTLVLTGSIHGFCGHAYGFGSGLFFDSTGNRVHLAAFSFEDTAFALRGTGVVDKPGTGQKGRITFTAGIVPPGPATPAGGSCAMDTAVIFQFVGGLATFTLS